MIKEYITVANLSLVSLSALLSNNIVLLFLGSICAFLLSYGLTFVIIAVARKFNWLDRSTAERTREHKVPVPRLGGVAIYLAFVVASLVFYMANPELRPQEFVIYWLLLASATLTVIVNVYDDIKGLKPLPKFIAQTVAVLLLMGPFIDAKFHGVLLFGFSNPFGSAIDNPTLPWYLRHEITLFIHTAPDQLPVISLLAIPAILLTWFWMVGMMNTINWIDGMDGLATGVVGITAFFIAVIAWMLNQHTIAILAGIFTGAILGFLPHNWNPAKIFMGDSGSQFLGLTLAALSIMGGAKIALALMVLGIPILDVAVVMINRVRRGQRPWHYDTTHLHQRLKATGWTVRQICYVLYGLTILFGVLAVLFKHLFKFLGLGLVVLTMAALIFWIDSSQRQGGSHIRLGGRDPEPPHAPQETPLPEMLVGKLEPAENTAVPVEEGKTY